MKQKFSEIELALRSNLRKRKQQQTYRKQNSTESQIIETFNLDKLSMDKIKIIGQKVLNGSVQIPGSKNSALPILAATILSNEEMHINNIPHLSDIDIILNILKELNVNVNYKDDKVVINAKDINNYTSSYDLASQMRASILVLGPLLSKYGVAKVPLPGGCSIGLRPVDIHISALEKMGATITLDHGYISAKVEGKLKGCDIIFEKVSVGATENIMMAATLAEGKTTLINASREPEIIDLANFLNKAGAKISGEGTDIITIEGVEALTSATHSVIADRIQAGSYAIAAIATKGSVILEDFDINLWGEFANKLQESGAIIKDLGNNKVECSYGGKIKAINISTEPHPGFSTDLQALWIVLMSIAEGTSVIEESIFENRFNHVPELLRMNADITIKGQHIVIVNGVKNLVSSEVKATDLRAAFALIIAALVAEGETTITKLHHLDRGYVDVVNKLSKLGANIRRGEHI